MDQIKQRRYDLSLRKSLVLYVTGFALLTLILYGITVSWCDARVSSIRASYPATGEKYYLTNERGEQLGDGAYISDGAVFLTERDERSIDLLEAASVIAAPAYSALCIIAAALLFYQNRLKKPLAELKEASEKISCNDLDFSLGYDRRDELGELIASFEAMRATLAGNFAEMWQQVEERKRLNAAFAHDLRTPLTVLKGYNEMLQADSKDAGRVRETAAIMGKHISRMETYIDSMSNLRRLEDTQPEGRAVRLGAFVESLLEGADIVCRENGKDLQRGAGKSLCRESLCQGNGVPDVNILMDIEFITEVCDNLTANAARYADKTVAIDFAWENDGLLLSVSDDGKGFGQDMLQKAADPYFTEEKDRAEHFGLGLYICKLLCERHGGFLRIENIPKGARVTAFFKSLSN